MLINKKEKHCLIINSACFSHRLTDPKLIIYWRVFVCLCVYIRVPVSVFRLRMDVSAENCWKLCAKFNSWELNELIELVNAINCGIFLVFVSVFILWFFGFSGSFMIARIFIIMGTMYPFHLHSTLRLFIQHRMKKQNKTILWHSRRSIQRIYINCIYI